MVEISSNVWGTRFVFKARAACLPLDLGQVVYKTSLLHLQPRQMKLRLRDLTDAHTLVECRDERKIDEPMVKAADGWCESDSESA